MPRTSQRAPRPAPAVRIEEPRPAPSPDQERRARRAEAFADLYDADSLILMQYAIELDRLLEKIWDGDFGTVIRRLRELKAEMEGEARHLVARRDEERRHAAEIRR